MWCEWTNAQRVELTPEDVQIIKKYYQPSCEFVAYEVIMYKLNANY